MRFVLLVLAALPIAAANDISGKWTIDGDVVGNPVNLNCSIRQDAAAKMTGKCTVNGSDSVDITGEVKDGKITFSFTSRSEHTLYYSGTVDGNTMKGDIEVSGASGTFSGKRDAS
jgi:hypothetical protein